MDLISVIVPVYNVEQYLDECVKSIVNQTYSNLEIILVDDGSSDRCPEICDKWAKKDSRICVIHQENGGLSAARNAGIDVAKGDYIGFVDSDDYIAEDMYEQLITALKQTDKKTACCLISRVFDNGKRVSDKTLQENNVILNEQQAIEANFYKKICNAVWCKLYSRTIFENLRFPVGEVNEDYPLIIPIIVKSGGMVLVNKALYCYRKREGSITSYGYATSRNAKFIYKNLELIGKQLSESEIKCTAGYSFFLARNSYDMALVMEKHKDEISDELKKTLSLYRKIMAKNMLRYIFSEYSSAKDKVLYLMVLTKSLRPIYALLKKKL